MTASRNQTGAFTLIELLVVIAVIALLASILLPALAKAKAQAWRARCTSHHKQLVLTWTLYQDDNDSALPANRRGRPLPNSGYALNWVESTIHGATPGFIDSGAFTDPKRAAFAPYLSTLEVYGCPAERTVYTVGERKVKKLRSYSMNEYLNAGAGQDMGIPFQFPPYKRNSEFGRPAELFVFIDVEPLSICFAPFLVPYADTGAVFNAPGALHDQKAAVLSYADGHSESHRWKMPVLRAATQALISNPHIPLEADPQDVHYIRSHAHHLLSQ